uniref:Tetratricopeptide TPR_2 repeat protein n=1 Tax=Solibacter usitatus (strain Ellin6076) TaxID=234267 RepID=Q01RE6_SOLUE
MEAVARGESEPYWRAHLEACADCREKVAESRDWREKVRLLRADDPGISDADCPSIEQLADFAAGLDPRGSSALLQHIACCDRCGAIVRNAHPADNEFGEESLMQTLHTATREGQHAMAVRFVAAEKHRIPILRAIGRHSWFAVAATIVLCAGSLLWWQNRRASEPQRLLALAYTAARPFEYRLPDAGYSEFHAKRSGSPSTFDRQDSLLKAETEIREQLKRNVRRPELLAMKGRAELLERQFDDAVADLTAASESDKSAAVLAELGVAYAARGDAEQRNLDRGQALEFLLEALQTDSKNTYALFNLAIVYDKLSMIDQSIAAWNRFLEVEPRGPWATEARQRLSNAEKKKQSKRAALNRLKEDAFAFLALVQSGQNIDVEYFQTAFWNSWLPVARPNSVALDAANTLAEAWARRFGDLSLRNALIEASRADESGSLSGLGGLIAGNVRGQNDEVLERAQKLSAEFARQGQTVAAFRARIEIAYSWRRSTHHEPCLAVTEAVLRELRGKPYPWLTGRAHLEHSICIARAGDLGAAQQERERTDTEVSRAGFSGLALQARQLLTSAHALSGNSAAVWETSPKELETYWSTAAGEASAQQALYDLALSAKAMGWKEAAPAVQGGAVLALERWGNRQLEAPNRVYLASLLQVANHHDEALRELKQADQIYKSLPASQTTNNLMLAGLLRKAETEASAQDAKSALADLDALSRLPNFSSLESRLRERQTRGIALMKLGDWEAAESSFRQAIALADRHVASFTRPIDRVGASEMALESRRNLVQIALLNRHDPGLALRIWEENRSAAFPPVAESDLALVYVVLPVGVAAWAFSRDRIRGELLSASATGIEVNVREFHRLCSTPASPNDRLQVVATRLHEQLVRPFGKEIEHARRIWIEPDDWLSLLPFRALRDDRGFWLAEQHPIGVISGLADLAPTGEAAISAASRMLVVSAPAAGARSRLPYLENAEREASDVSASSGQPALLTGPGITPEQIAREIRQASLFHFSGHGWANGGNGALILGPDTEGGSRFLTAADLAAHDWQKCRLAVLSACLTASGEERGPVNPRSLVRALLAAGAKRVMAARWSIDDGATGATMHSFYSSLFQGKSPTVALNEASAEVRGSHKWQHPYYWAAFDVFGTP